VAEAAAEPAWGGGRDWAARSWRLRVTKEAAAAARGKGGAVSFLGRRRRRQLLTAKEAAAAGWGFGGVLRQQASERPSVHSPLLNLGNIFDKMRLCPSSVAF
jgi:hypothetical protein